MSAFPHSYLYNGSPICWCGENHPCPDCTECGGNDKAGTCRCEWLPMTEAALDALKCEAMEPFGASGEAP